MKKDKIFSEIFGNKSQFAVSNRISPPKTGEKQVERKFPRSGDEEEPR
jgi:hypothetical protein